jgi:hypothetical protein
MQKLRNPNIQASSESWLKALIDELRPLYAASGLIIPEKIRGTIAFTSHGKPGRDDLLKGSGPWPAECWPAAATDDGFVEIIIRADHADPLAIAGFVCHELIHAAQPDAKHGREFRDAALRLGFEGPMRQALPGPALRERLNTILEAIGPLPRARLNFDRVTKAGLAIADRPKTQTTRMLKAECMATGCGYTVRVAARWIIDCGPPHCPKHGAMVTPLTANDAGDDTAEGDGEVKASPAAASGSARRPRKQSPKIPDEE